MKVTSGFNQNRRSVHRVLLLVASLVVSSCLAQEPPKVAVHYYPWYTTSRWNYQECVAGTLRSQLIPGEAPLLGNYTSSTKAVLDTHLRWCSEYNLDTLILEFYGPNTDSDLVCRNNLFKNAHAPDVHMSVLYDWAIRFGDFAVTSNRLITVSNDFVHLSKYYLSQTNYLRSPDGSAVVYLYVTRALTGDLDGFVRTMRAAAAALNQTLFLVGDEFFFISSPDLSRIRRWDAIFGYDVCASRGGYWGQNGNLNYFTNQMTAFRKAANSVQRRFMPSIMPGFNDRAIRRTCANNPAAGRRLTPGSDSVSLFRATFDRALASEIDQTFPVLCVTSFNEWHEDTMIEPTTGTAASTSLDSSNSGSQYAQGLIYDDYGFAYLEFIRNRTVAISGHVFSSTNPVPSARIEIRLSNTNVATIEADTFGYYKVLRPMAPTNASVTVQVVDGIRGLSLPTTATPQPLATITNIDLQVTPPPTLGFQNTTAGIAMSFSSVAGLVYEWQSSVDLISWSSASDKFTGTGEIIINLQPTTNTASFFRLQIFPYQATPVLKLASPRL